MLTFVLLLLLLLFILFGVPSKLELNTKLVYKFPSSSIFYLGQMGPEELTQPKPRIVKQTLSGGFRFLGVL